MADKKPDISTAHNAVLETLISVLGERTMKAMDMQELNRRIREACNYYYQLPKARTRKKVSPLQKQAMADVAKAADLQ